MVTKEKLLEAEKVLYADPEFLIDRGKQTLWSLVTPFVVGFVGMLIRLCALVGLAWMGYSVVELDPTNHLIIYVTPFALFALPLSLMVGSQQSWGRRIWHFLLLVALSVFLFKIFITPNPKSNATTVTLGVLSFVLLALSFWISIRSFFRKASEPNRFFQLAWPAGLSLSFAFLTFIGFELLRQQRPEASTAILTAFLLFGFFFFLVLIRLYWMDSERDRRARRIDRNPVSETVLLLEWFLPRSAYFFFLLPCLLFSEALLFKTIYCYTPQKASDRSSNHCTSFTKRNVSTSTLSKKKKVHSASDFMKRKEADPAVIPTHLKSGGVSRSTSKHRKMPLMGSRHKSAAHSQYHRVTKLHTKTSDGENMSFVEPAGLNEWLRFALAPYVFPKRNNKEVYGPKWMQWLGRFVWGLILFMLFKQPLMIWLLFSKAFYTLKSLEDIEELPPEQRKLYQRQREETLEHIRSHLDNYGSLWRKLIFFAVTASPRSFRRFVLSPRDAILMLLYRVTAFFEKLWFRAMLCFAFGQVFLMLLAIPFFRRESSLIWEALLQSLPPLFVGALFMWLVEKRWKPERPTMPPRNFWLLLPIHSCIELSLFYLIKKSGNTSDLAQLLLLVLAWFSAMIFPVIYVFLSGERRPAQDTSPSSQTFTTSSLALQPFFQLQQRNWVISSSIFRIHPVWSEFFSVVRILPSGLMSFVKWSGQKIARTQELWSLWRRSQMLLIFSWFVMLFMIPLCFWLVQRMVQISQYGLEHSSGFESWHGFVFLVWCSLPSLLGLSFCWLRKRYFSTPFTLFHILILLGILDGGISLLLWHPWLRSSFGVNLTSFVVCAFFSFPWFLFLYKAETLSEQTLLASETTESRQTLLASEATEASFPSTTEKRLQPSPSTTEASEELNPKRGLTFSVDADEFAPSHWEHDSLSSMIPLEQEESIDVVLNKRKSLLERLEEFEAWISGSAFFIASFFGKLGGVASQETREQLLFGLVKLLQEAQQSLMTGKWYQEEERALHRIYHEWILPDPRSHQPTPAEELAILFEHVFNLLGSLLYDLTNPKHAKLLPESPRLEVVLETLEAVAKLPRPHMLYHSKQQDSLNGSLSALQSLLLKQLEVPNMERSKRLRVFTVLSVMGQEQAQDILLQRAEAYKRDVLAQLQNSEDRGLHREQVLEFPQLLNTCGHNATWAPWKEQFSAPSETSSSDWVISGTQNLRAEQKVASRLLSQFLEEKELWHTCAYRAAQTSFVRLTFPTPVVHVFQAYDKARQRFYREYKKNWEFQQLSAEASQSPDFEHERTEKASQSSAFENERTEATKWQLLRQPPLLREGLTRLQHTYDYQEAQEELWLGMKRFYFSTCGFLLALLMETLPPGKHLRFMGWSTPQELKESLKRMASFFEASTNSETPKLDTHSHRLWGLLRGKVVNPRWMDLLSEHCPISPDQLREYSEEMERYITVLCHSDLCLLAVFWTQEKDLSGRENSENVPVPVTVFFQGEVPCIHFGDASPSLPEGAWTLPITDVMDWGQYTIFKPLSQEAYEQFLSKLQKIAFSPSLLEEPSFHEDGSSKQQTKVSETVKIYIQRLRYLAKEFSLLQPPGTRQEAFQKARRQGANDAHHMTLLPSLASEDIQQTFTDIWTWLDYLERQETSDRLILNSQMKSWQAPIDIESSLNALYLLVEKYKEEQKKQLWALLAAGLLPQQRFGFLWKIEEADDFLIYWYQDEEGTTNWRLQLSPQSNEV